MPSLRLSATVAVFLAPISALFAAPALTLSPELTEGPFYTLSPQNTLPAPADQDNDLTRVGSATIRARGSVLLLSGTVVDPTGKPVAGATIELWQTDTDGVYYHSNEPKLSLRDPHFQSFGKTVTAKDGSFAFRTIKPGLYTGRIRHFHYRVKIADRAVLTSQLVFADQRAEFFSDNVTGELSGTALEATVIDPRPGTDAAGNSVLIATRQIVIDPNATPAPARGGPPPPSGNGRFFGPPPRRG